VVTISGVGFFDIPHTQKPHAGNFAELHPVTGIKFVYEIPTTKRPALPALPRATPLIA